MSKFATNLFKFFVSYSAFGFLGILLLFFSANCQSLLETGESLISPLLHASSAPNPIAAENAAILKIFDTAFHSVPWEELVSSILGVNFEVTSLSEMISAVFALFKGEGALQAAGKTLLNYDDFWREAAIAACASFVLYAVTSVKNQITKKDWATHIGFSIISIYWVLAAYCFGKSLILAVTSFIGSSPSLLPYITIVFVAILAEGCFTVLDTKKSPLKILLILSTHLFFNLLRCAFLLLLCHTFSQMLTQGYDKIHPAEFLLSIGTILVSGAIVVCTFLIEMSIVKKAERKSQKN